MADEFELDLESPEDINKTELRIKNLSSKVRETSLERDEAKTAAETAQALAETAQKERDFFKGFSAISEKYPGATEFQDAILEKVNAGYSHEDATLSVLNANGKLTAPVAPAPQPITGAGGGSAATVIPDNSQKAVTDMTQAERREALMNPEIQGELEAILRGK